MGLQNTLKNYRGRSGQQKKNMVTNAGMEQGAQRPQYVSRRRLPKTFSAILVVGCVQDEKSSGTSKFPSSQYKNPQLKTWQRKWRKGTSEYRLDLTFQ